MKIQESAVDTNPLEMQKNGMRTPTSIKLQNSIICTHCSKHTGDPWVIHVVSCFIFQLSQDTLWRSDIEWVWSTGQHHYSYDELRSSVCWFNYYNLIVSFSCQHCMHALLQLTHSTRAYVRVCVDARVRYNIRTASTLELGAVLQFICWNICGLVNMLYVRNENLHLNLLERLRSIREYLLCIDSITDRICQLNPIST